MKKIIAATLTTLILSLDLYALEAHKISEIVKDIEQSKFKFKERGLVFGFDRIQSCLYVSSEFLILRNYCYPQKDYPAKSFTVISKKWGITEYYQERFGSIQKRDARISVFSEISTQYFTKDFEKESISSINVNFEKFENSFTPACWSTNYSDDEGVPTYGCYGAPLETIIGIESWVNETQDITTNASSWRELFIAIERALLTQNKG